MFVHTSPNSIYIRYRACYAICFYFKNTILPQNLRGRYPVRCWCWCFVSRTIDLWWCWCFVSRTIDLWYRTVDPWYNRSMVPTIKLNHESLSLCASLSLYPLTRTYPRAGTGYHVNEQYLRHVVRILFSSRFVLCSCNDHVLHTSIHFQKNVLV